MKKIISVFLIAVLLISCFSGCLFRRKDADKDGSKKTTANVKGPERGPVGVWDIPVPEINPLGSQSLYGSTGYSKGSHDLKYIENFAENSKTVTGEVWTLQVADPSGIPLEFLKEYITELGANIYSNVYGDVLTFTYGKDEDSLWWGDARQDDSGYNLTVVKEPHVPAGKEKKFSTAVSPDEDEPSVTFVTQTDGKKFQSAEISVPDGALYLEISSYAKTGILTRTVDYRRELISSRSRSFVLDDLPQTSDPLIWSFRWEDGQAPAEFTFKLNELGDIPAIKQGDELGMLKVCGVPSGNASVEPQNGVEYEYGEEYSLEGDVTPEGDTVFWLPAGYWNVLVPTETSGLYSCKARLVPVSAGQETVLTLPDSLSSSYTTLSQYFAEPGELTGRITITETKDEGATASISMMVEDPQNRDVFPNKQNTVITEGGQKAEILDITRQIAPPSIVLVLDSSGSMGNLMPATIESAKKFINGLPDKTFIKVIDFDSTIRVLKGETKEAVVKSLSSVKASGSTMLFDATLEGLGLLEGKIRPAVVLFADGADSSLDGQGEGSSSTKEDVIDSIKEAGIPLYTIGFREGADKQAMKDFAAASGGEYYDAKDNKALDKVFEAIGSKFGNSFVMKYKRPVESALSDKPVVSFILDASGSMDTDPAEEEGCDFRMDRTKVLFHDFIMKLPEQSLFQMISFQTGPLGGNIIQQQQVTTDDRMRMLQGLGSLDAGGGTPILDSIRIGYENLISVPTSKRVMVFMTDAALEVDEEDQMEFEKLLGEIKKDNIIVLWAGMGVEDKKPVFERAAQLSGGRYVVSEDAEGLKSALEEILGLIGKESGSVNVPISVSINEQTASGDLFKYAASQDVEFSRPSKSGKAADPQPIKLTTGTAVKQYDKEVASLLTGTSKPGEESIMTRRISYNKKAKNSAMEISVGEAFYFDKFKGLDAPSNKCFLALELDLKNVTSKNITYEIPSFQNHFYMTTNNEGSYPASDATWLTEKPIAVPGDPGIVIPSGQTVSGMIVFLVPEGAVTQASLHFYDTSEGHIHMPLVGRINPQFMELNSKPASTPANITDAFTIKVTATKDTDVIDVHKAEDNTAFRVIEAQFDSKVQALLDIEPSDRFYLKINTNSGPLMTKLSNATTALPLGFMSPVKLAPSSVNKVRLAYPVAKALSATQAELWADLQNGSLQIPITDGKAYGSTVNKPSLSAQGLQLRINQLTTLDQVEPYNSSWAVADVTFTCPVGTEGAVIPEDIFYLVREDLANSGYIDLSSVSRPASDNEEEADSSDNEESGDDESYEDEESYDDEDSDDDDESSESTGGIGLGDFGNINATEGVVLPDLATAHLLYGIDGDWGVYSGTQRRGFVLFSLPDEESKWTLKSNYFTDLNESLTKSAYTSSELLVQQTEIETFSDEFEQLLSEAVKKAELKYQSVKSSNGSAGFTKTIDFTQGDGKNYIPVPTIVTHGAEKISSVKDISQALSMLQSLKWMPSADVSWRYRYAPEAVLTQGWGSEWDLGYLATGLIAKCGYTPSSRCIALTDEGRAKLNELCPAELEKNRYMPGISYIDENGAGKLLVIPFMKDISELEGLVYITGNQEADEYTPVEASISVSVKIESDGSSEAAVANDISNALGGAGESDTKILDEAELLSKTISLADLSTDLIEVGFMEAGKGVGTKYMAAISTPGGVEPGEYAIDSGKDRVYGIKITFALPDKEFVHESELREGDRLDRIYHNIAINLPDLPKEAVNSLQNAADKEYKAAQNPSSLSALKWYGRNIINRFITAQTAYDKEIGENMGLVLGRTSKERIIVLTSRLNEKDSKFRTSMDLLQAVNQCQNGDKDTQAAYNIGAGIFVSILEGDALTGKNRINFLDLWMRAPKGTSMVLIPNTEDGKDSAIAALEKSGYPERLTRTIQETENIVITLDRPVEFDGQKRWAWLEINPQTYETISVFDTGEHMSAEYREMLRTMMEDGGKFVAGAFMGIEVSIWAVGAFSLELSNYKDIMAAAEQYSLEIGKYLDAVMKGYGAARDLEFTFNDVVGLATGKEIDEGLPATVECKVNVLEGYEQKFKQKIFGFKEGYDNAVKVYFKISRGG